MKLCEVNIDCQIELVCVDVNYVKLWDKGSFPRCIP